MKMVIEIDLPNGTTFLDSAALGAISRVLSSASESFDICYDEQEASSEFFEVPVHELPWRWKAVS